VHLYTDLVPSADPDVRGMKRPRAVSAVTRRIAEQVHAHSREGRMTLTLGGDHSIAIGTIGGVAKATRERLGRETAVIWVDAHGDINTPETSGSGNIHGMPVAFLTGLARGDDEAVFGWLGDEHRVSLNKLVYIGLRDVDVGEKKILRENGVKAFSMFDIDRFVTPPLQARLRTGTRKTDPLQARHRQGYGYGARAHRRRHPDPPLLRRRCAGSHVGAVDGHAGPRRADAARGRLHL
jgi:arginase